MFKPLLRVLPSLSGNIKLCCAISDYDPTDDPNVFDCYIRSAKLTPISSNNDKAFVNVNLLQSMYENNVASLYEKEHDFWKSKFVYDKQEVEYINLDDYSVRDTQMRDTDFEFGCKRLSFQKQGYQFGFFAPIYIDNYDDLPSYFLIKLEYYIDRNKVERKVWELEDKITKLFEKYGSYTVISMYFRQALAEDLGKETMNLFDLNGDGKVNSADKVIFDTYWPYYGDGKLHIEGTKLDISRIVSDKEYNDDIWRKRDRYTTTKYLKVYINKEHVKNYLGKYLQRYLSKIDDTVIYCQPKDNIAIYHGIDVNSGAFVKVEDNYFGANYNNQQTINRFDYTICNGFERNNLIMKQIIPLAFYFNVDSLLSKLSVGEFNFANIKVTGAYYNDADDPIIMHDFSIDYMEFYTKYLKLNERFNVMDYVTSNDNVMADKGALGLNESGYYNYIFANKISPNYTRWKLKYSSDTLPYITNMSRSYGVDKAHPYRYGQVPLKRPTIQALANVKFTNDHFDYNIILPLGTTKRYYNDNYSDLSTKYLDRINNYFSSWFASSIDFSFEDTSIFKSVHDNKVYYKGLLYNLENLMSYTNKHYDIDYFGIIIRPTINDIKTDDSIFTTILLTQSININVPCTNVNVNDSLWNTHDELYRLNLKNNRDNFAYNVPMKRIGTFKYENGTLTNIGNGESVDLERFFDTPKYVNIDDKAFIHTDEDGKTVDNYSYYKINRYYSYDQLIATLKDKGGYEQCRAQLDQIDKIDGYILLPIYNVKSLSYSDNKGSNMFLLNYIDEILKDKLYYSTKDSFAKQKVFKDAKNIDESFFTNTEQEYYNLFYISDTFIKASVVDKMLVEKLPENVVSAIHDELKEYSYSPFFIYNNTTCGEKIFILIDKNSPFYYRKSDIDNIDDDDYVIYIDSYNINHIEKTVDTADGKYLDLITQCGLSDAKPVYARFLNDLHFKYYIDELYKISKVNEDAASNNNKTKSEILDNVFIKIRYVDTATLDTKDEVIPIKNIIDSSKKLNDKDINDVILKLNGNIMPSGIFTLPQDYISNEFNSILPSITVNNATYLYFELYFKKDFYKLNKSVLKNVKFVDADDNLGAYIDLYFYRPIQPEEYHINVIPSTTINESDKHNIFLVPLFNDIFAQNKTATQIFAEYQLSNLTEVKTNIPEGIISNEDNADDADNKRNQYTYYRYNTNEVICMVNFSDASILPESQNIDIYEKIDNTAINPVVEHNDLKLPYNTNINTHLYNGKLYAYYLVDLILDNSNNSFNLIGQLKENIQNGRARYRYDNNIKYFYYINGQSIFNDKIYTKINNANIVNNNQELYKLKDDGSYDYLIKDDTDYYIRLSDMYIPNRLPLVANQEYYTKTPGQYVEVHEMLPGKQYYKQQISYSYEIIQPDEIYTGDKYEYITEYKPVNRFEEPQYYNKSLPLYYNFDNVYRVILDPYYMEDDVYVKVDESTMNAGTDNLYFKNGDKYTKVTEETVPEYQLNEYTLYYKTKDSNRYYSLHNVNSEDFPEEILETLNFDTMYYHAESISPYIDITMLTSDKEYYVKEVRYISLANYTKTLDTLNEIYYYDKENNIYVKLVLNGNPLVYKISRYEESTNGNYKQIESKQYIPIGPSEYPSTYYEKEPDTYTLIKNPEPASYNEYYVKNSYIKYAKAHKPYDKTGKTEYYVYENDEYAPVITDDGSYYTVSIKYNIGNNLNEIAPFLKINILDSFKNIASNTMVQPTTFDIKHTLSRKKWSKEEGYTNIRSTETSILYDSNLKEGYISLERYFDSITPLILPAISIKNNYFIKKKIVKEDILKYANSLTTLDTTIYHSPIYIDNYPGITLWQKNPTYSSARITSLVYDKMINPFYPAEWKYYNDNMVINTPALLTYKLPTTITYDEILTYQSDEKTYEIFKTIINKNRKNNPFSESDILFLFNKYEKQYDTVPAGLTPNMAEKVYTFTYKFILL